MRVSTRSGMYTTYLIIVTWRSNRGGTWHVVWGLLILVTVLLSLWISCLVELKAKYFWFVTWPHNWSVMWLCGWIPLILSHPPLYESRNITFFICLVTTMSTWLCGCGSLILRHHPAKFGVHRSCESRDKTFLICHKTTWPMCHMTLLPPC